MRAVALTLAVTSPALAQIPAPNPMAAHTVFILLLVGAFLGWAASFSVHTIRKTRSKKEELESLHARREQILDALASAENALETEAMAQELYEQRYRELRAELARVLARLGNR